MKTQLLPSLQGRRSEIAAPGTSEKPFRSAAEGGHGIRYRPDIDGLRTLAVVPVVLYHAHVAPFGGGFVGVDIFFVISGYLITSTLLGDLRQGRLSVLDFYERRVRRIFPALFAMLLCCTLATALFAPPDAFDAFGHSMIAVALFLSNVFFWFNGGVAGYFGDASTTQLLLHTWSLAVEEQFYIFLPILLMLVGHRGRRTIVFWLALFAAASFALSVWTVAHRPAAAFYLVFPRAWELLVGGLVAAGIVPPLASRAGRELASAGGVALIAAAVFLFSNRTSFPGATALLPCLGAVLVIHAGETGESRLGAFLASRPFVYVGKRSYSLYLWHWPFVVLFMGLNTGLLNAPSTLLILAASFAAASLSYRFIEQPFRRRRDRRRGPALVGAVAVSLAALVVGLSIVLGGGLPVRFDAAKRTLIAANLARMNDHDDGSCGNWRTDVHTLDDITFCPLGHEGQRKILFWGDSHLGVLRPLIKDLYDEDALGGRGAIFAIAAGCLPSSSMDRREAGYHCNAFSRLALARAKDRDVDTVFLAFSANWADVDGELCLSEDGRCRSRLSRQQEEDTFIADLSASVRDLRTMGKRVIITLPIPTYNLVIPSMEVNLITLGAPYRELRDAGILRKLARKDFLTLRERITAVAETLGAEIYDPRQNLCDGDHCDYQRDGVSIYADDNHIALDQTGIFRESLRLALR